MIKEAVEKCLADQEKTLQGDIARDRATLERERESHNEHVRSVTTDLDKRSVEIEEEKSNLQKALQDNRELGEELWEWRLAHVIGPVEKCKNEEDLESQSRIKHNNMVELQKMLDTKTAELQRLQDKEATGNNNSDISHDELYATLYRRRRS